MNWLTKPKVITPIAIAFAIVVALWYLIMPVATQNKCEDEEGGVIAAYDNAQSVHATFYTQMKAQGVVLQDYDKAYIDGLMAKYGTDGIDGVLLMLAHDNVLPPDMHKKMAQIIEAGYADFHAAQQLQVERCRVYFKGTLTKWPWASFAEKKGYPRDVEKDKHCRVITSAVTDHDYETGHLSNPDLGGLGDD